jgi:hypothetical protein
MRQPSLFHAGPVVREKASPMARAAEEFRKNNLACAKRALADPIRYDYLLTWATLVIEKDGRLSECESV